MREASADETDASSGTSRGASNAGEQDRSSALAVSEEESEADGVSRAADFNIEDFRTALAANPEAVRFRINNEAGVLSLQALNENLIGAQSRSENMTVTRTLRTALATEHPNVNVNDLFVVDPMTKLTSYPSLSAERLRALFERIDLATAPVAVPSHDDDVSLPEGRVLSVVTM